MSPATLPVAAPRRPRPPIWLLLLLASLAAAVLLLWPLPAYLDGHTPDTNADALHQAWTIRWIQHAMTSADAELFAAPTNYPYTRALTLSQPLYTAALLSLPLYLLGWSPIAIHNLLVLLSFVLACWSMALLGWQLTRRPLAGLVAGLLYAYADVRLAHLGHLNILSGFWMVLLLAVVLRLWRDPPQSRRLQAVLVVLAGALAAAQALADVYNGVYMIAALALLALYHLVTRRWGLSLRLTLALGASALVAALLCLPLFQPTLAAWDELGIVRAYGDHDLYGARLKNYLVPVRPSALGYDLRQFREPGLSSGGAEHALWPGLLTLALAALGLLAARREERQQQGFFALLVVVAFFLSLGPTIRSGEGDPGQASTVYRWLYDHVSLFAAVRVATRWALLVQLGLAILAAYGFAALLRLAARPATARARLAAALGPALVLGLVAGDLWRGPLRPDAQIVGQPVPQVYGALRGLPPGPLVEWPFEHSSQLLGHYYEYYTLFHGRPLVNSAASVAPPRYGEIKDLMAQFPSVSTVTFLRDLGVRYLNVNRWELSGWPALQARIDALSGLRLVGSYEDGRHVLYEVLPAQPSPEQGSGELSTSANGSLLALQLPSAIWIDAPAEVYRAPRPVEVLLARAQGEPLRATVELPPVLLPGRHELALPVDAAGATELLLPRGDRVPLRASAMPPDLVGQLAPGPQLVYAPLTPTAAAGSTLSCRAYGKGPLPTPGLVFSTVLIDPQWQVYAKQDRFFTEGLPAPDQWRPDAFTLIPCDLPLPADLPPGEYQLVLGLYDPARGEFVPVAGRDGASVQPQWQTPPITVAPGS